MQASTSVLHSLVVPNFPTTMGSPSVCRIGRGSAIAHHGEILQGVFQARDGRLRRGLITLRSDLFKSEATFTPYLDDGLQVEPNWKTKARRAAELALTALGAGNLGGWLQIDSNIPLRLGLGSSTSDVTGAIRAVSDALGAKLSSNLIARLAVAAEKASDSIMYDDRVILFAHREGAVIEDLGGVLPAMKILGFNTDPSGAGVDTLGFAPARYTWSEIESFRPLVGLMRRAIQAQDVRLVGRVATASARINQRHLPKPQFDMFEQIVEEVGAVGLQIAHSGSVVGFIFDPADPDVSHRVQWAESRLYEANFGPFWQFQTGEEESAIKWDSIELADQSLKPANSPVWFN